MHAVSLVISNMYFYYVIILSESICVSIYWYVESLLSLFLSCVCVMLQCQVQSHSYIYLMLIYLHSQKHINPSLDFMFTSFFRLQKAELFLKAKLFWSLLFGFYLSFCLVEYYLLVGTLFYLFKCYCEVINLVLSPHVCPAVLRWWRC